RTVTRSDSFAVVSVTEAGSKAARSEKLLFCFHCSTFEYADLPSRKPALGTSVHNIVNCSGDRYGSGLSNAAFSTLNIAVFAPMARASTTIEVTVKLELLRRVRA